MSRGRGAAAPYALGLDMWLLGMESAMVIGLRTLKLAAGGPAGEIESRRMVVEKIAALAELPLVLARSGQASPEALTRSALRYYTRKVRANRRRLSAPQAGRAGT